MYESLIFGKIKYVKDEIVTRPSIPSRKQRILKYKAGSSLT